MDVTTTAFRAELEKIAEESRRRKRVRGAALLAGGALSLAAGGFAVRKGAKSLLSEASSEFAAKIQDGVRKGVRAGFDQGVAGMHKKAPEMTDDVIRRMRPEIDSIIDAAANRAHAEAPKIGEGVAQGFSGAVKSRLPWRR